MAYADYKPNHAGVAELLRSDKMAAVITDAADVIADRARSIAPVRTGRYRESIQVVSDLHPTRAAAHVGPHIGYGLLVELKTHVMRRALG
jgi:hypothetical protein